MPAPIGKLPKGLLALLALRNHGEAPQAIADQLVGTTDLTELYLLDTRERTPTLGQVTPIVGANVFTNATDATVPPGQLWYVWQYAVIATPAAGEAIRLAPAVQLDGNGLQSPLTAMQSAVAGEEIRPAADRPFWAGPGSQLGFLVQSLTLAPDVVGAAIITRLRV